MKNLFTKIALLAVSVMLMSWGSTGHHKINNDASLSFNQQMSQFDTWTNTLAEHASDADYRKKSDPSESPKHFIDIDNYYMFQVTGRIPQTWDSIIAYGPGFVSDNGILPWATVITADSLRACFQRGDWDKAVLVAADLGHYVGDGHMPLHITANFDGQNTGNDGIHSRYESTMINNHIDEIIYQGDTLIHVIPDINQYVFDYIYHNYSYVDSVLAADNYAQNLSGGSTNSSVYNQALWDKTKGFTIQLFAHASHSLAELIYTAWVQAGSPTIPSASIFDQDVSTAIFLNQNIPNPFLNLTQIKYTLLKNSNVLLQVKDANGKLVETLIDKHMAAGSHSQEWKPLNLSAGVYYLVLKTEKSSAVKKMVLIK